MKRKSLIFRTYWGPIVKTQKNKTAWYMEYAFWAITPQKTMGLMLDMTKDILGSQRVLKGPRILDPRCRSRIGSTNLTMLNRFQMGTLYKGP